ncbi:MAG: iron hydrogenase small subunit [Chitinispirillaceae bacterium]|nr:iron hydrogenase small subunit [Chitinispirillaceae bacterium]
MVTIEINGKKQSAKHGVTILSVLKELNIHVPSLCNMEELSPTGACRLCVVEVEGMRTLVPSCSFPVADGMKIQTHSQRVLRARKTIIELLLANHPDDCLYCVRNGTCELQTLAEEMNVRERHHVGFKHQFKKDISSTSIVRDPEKCILCGRCVRVCEEIQTVSAIDFIGRGCTTQVGTAFNEGLNVSTCINCGQCIMVCPTGALTEKSNIEQVEAALRDPDCIVIVQHAPSISVSLGEEFGLPAGFDVCGSMNAALRDIGFARVFDTGFSADLTIMEEASELVHRISTGGVLPMFTSCSPGWIKFVEHNYPEFIPNLSTCKSPQQMMGAVIKSYYAEKENIDPKRIFSVAIMPCTAKKFEADRPEMGQNAQPDIDAVLTTRELAKLLRKFGVVLDKVEPEEADNPLGTRSTAGKIFGATGGVMEAAVRTAHYLLTGKEMENLVISEVRELKGVKEASVTIDNLKVGIAVASGLGNARKLLDQIKAGRSDLHFIEIMTCPGGCIAGGGQPFGIGKKNIRARMKKLYDIDRQETIRTSHNNPMIKQLYDDFLEKPLGKKSHKLLHTHYHERSESR